MVGPIAEVPADGLVLFLDAFDVVPLGPAAEAERKFAAFALVGRFDRRGTEPFELFRSEFGQNSFKIQEFSLENSNFLANENFNINLF